jgi:hypothetical protein
MCFSSFLQLFHQIKVLLHPSLHPVCTSGRLREFSIVRFRPAHHRIDAASSSSSSPSLNDPNSALYSHLRKTIDESVPGGRNIFMLRGGGAASASSAFEIVANSARLLQPLLSEPLVPIDNEPNPLPLSPLTGTACHHIAISYLYVHYLYKL